MRRTTRKKPAGKGVKATDNSQKATEDSQKATEESQKATEESQKATEESPTNQTQGGDGESVPVLVHAEVHQPPQASIKAKKKKRPTSKSPSKSPVQLRTSPRKHPEGKQPALDDSSAEENDNVSIFFYQKFIVHFLFLGHF